MVRNQNKYKFYFFSLFLFLTISSRKLSSFEIHCQTCLTEIDLVCLINCVLFDLGFNNILNIFDHIKDYRYLNIFDLYLILHVCEEQVNKINMNNHQQDRPRRVRHDTEAWGKHTYWGRRPKMANSPRNRVSEGFRVFIKLGVSHSRILQLKECLAQSLEDGIHFRVLILDNWLFVGYNEFSYLY